PPARPRASPWAAGRSSVGGAGSALVSRTCDGPGPRPVTRRPDRRSSVSTTRPIPVGCGGGGPRAGEQLLDGGLRADRVDREAGAELEAADLPQPGVDLPVPVVGLVDALAKRRRVE